MTRFTVGICGAGIAGVCLALELMESPDIRIDLYESSAELSATGASITISRKAQYVLRKMGLEDACVRACQDAGEDRDSIFYLRGPDLEGDFGTLPLKDALRISRGEFMKIVAQSLPRNIIRLRKRLVKYSYVRENGPIGLQFSDGTRAVCDVLIGCDGVRSIVRGQFIRDKALADDDDRLLKHVEPRWSGTVIYRSLIPKSRLAAQNPNHSLLSAGQIYLGKSQHITAHPFRSGMLDVAISITDLSKEGSVWPSTSWSSQLDKEAARQKLSEKFSNWNKEAQDIVRVFETTIKTAVMDVEPLPCHVRGHVALIGDAGHAALPYTGGNATMAIEDAYALGRILKAAITTKSNLPIALKAYQRIRKPYGNRNIHNARQVLREFQFNGNGDDMEDVVENISYCFNETFATAGSTPDADVRKALDWMISQISQGQSGASGSGTA